MATLERFGPMGHDLVILDESRGPISVGKSPDNDLVLDGDPSISRFTPGSSAWVRPGASPTSVRRTAPRSMVSGCSRRGTLHDRDEVLLGLTRLVLRDPTARGDVTTTPVQAAARSHARRAAGARRALPARDVRTGVHPAVVRPGDRRSPRRHRVRGQAATRPAVRQVRHLRRGGRFPACAARQRGDPAGAVTMRDLQRSEH